MKRTIIVFVIVGLFSLESCGPVRKMKFTTSTFMSAGRKIPFAWSIPKGFKDNKETSSQHILKDYYYKDSARLYISLDISYANSPNWKNWTKCSRPAEKFKCESGQQDDGRLWREIKSNDLVIGYLNVSKTEKEKFDKALESLAIHQNK